jgi:hypothetical protein
MGLRSRLRKKLDQSPSYYTQGVVLNRMGLQVARCVAAYAWWRLRPRRVTPGLQQHVATLDRDGLLILPDFFPQADFLALKEEFERTRSEPDVFPYHTEPDGPTHYNLLHETLALRPPIAKLPTFRRLLQENSFLLDLVAAAVRRPIPQYPMLVLEVIRKRDHVQEAFDIQNVLHADRHFPNIKMAYYLNDHSPENGAFVYAKGSHALTTARLRHEYRMSVDIARCGGQVPDAIRRSAVSAERLQHGRVCLTEADIRAMNLRPESVCAPANTLVVSNMAGFHRRGDLSPGQVRLEARLSFQYLETWSNILSRKRVAA